MPVVSYHVGFLSGLLTPFATLRSLLEAGGSTSKTLTPSRLFGSLSHSVALVLRAVIVMCTLQNRL
jgi:hypothetical protein